jgi:non-haem Fe2+, alpha-ketoglutarate-dependent halogenase
VTNRLSREELSTYERDGALFPIRVLTTDEVQEFRSSLESLAENFFEGQVKRIDHLHLWFDWAYRLAVHPAVLDAVESLIGDDILVDGSLVLCKAPHDPSYASWHQDSVYSGWHLTPSTSAWIALSPSNSINGCMRVIPGSHLQGVFNHITCRDDANLLQRGERVDVAVDERQAVDIVLHPGEMSLHHCNIIHGSCRNRSEERRIGFIVRFVTSRIQTRGRPVLRVRGGGDCSHLDLAQPPAAAINQAHAFGLWTAFDRCQSANESTV